MEKFHRVNPRLRGKGIEALERVEGAQRSQQGLDGGAMARLEISQRPLGNAGLLSSGSLVEISAKPHAAKAFAKVPLKIIGVV